MAEPVGYYSPDTARMVLRVIEELKRSGYVSTGGKKEPPRGAGITSTIAYTPAGGIAARSGGTCSSAECQVYRINESGTLTAVKDNQGSNLFITVYHLGSSAVAGTTYIQAKRCFGQWVADFEDCV